MSGLRRTLAVAEREWRALFAQPTAWVFLSAFLLIGTVFGLTDFFARGVADLRDYFSGLRYALVLLAPAAAMRVWAAERSSGTQELLFATPVRPFEAVAGKYLAGLGVIALGLLAGAVLPLSLLPFAEFDLGQIACGYLGAFLLASAFLALGGLASALSPSQEVAFLTGAGACLLLNLAGDERLIERAAEVFPRRVVTAGADFATGPHYDALTRGLVELRGLVYFLGLAAWALFCTTLLVERRGRRGAEPWIAGGLALVALGLGINVANQRSLALRVDLSVRGANSLDPSTEEALADLEGELVVRAYLSRHKLPESLLPRVRGVLDLLEDVELAGRGKVRLEVLDPTTPELQEAAERQGVKRFQLQVSDPDGGVSLRTVYAGVVLFYEGRPPAAIPVALDARGGLEYQLALALRTLTGRRPRIALGGSGGFGPDQVPEAANALQRLASIEHLDLTHAAEVDRRVDLAVFIAPRPPSPREVYALDQHLQRGGKLLLLLEGSAPDPQDAWRRVPFPAGLWQETLRSWGVELGPLLLAVSPRRFTVRGRSGATIQTSYPWFLQPSGRDNPGSAVGGGLPMLLLPFATELRPRGEAEVLLRSPLAWGLAGSQDVDPGARLELVLEQRTQRSLGLGFRKEFLSPWAGKPGVIAPSEVKTDPLASPLAQASGKGTLVVIGDADFLDPSYLRSTPGNLDLLLNSAEWCLQGAQLAGVRGRAQPRPLHGLEARPLGLRPRDLIWGVHLLFPLLLLAGGLGRLGWRRVRGGREASRLRTALVERAEEPQGKADSASSAVVSPGDPGSGGES